MSTHLFSFPRPPVLLNAVLALLCALACDAAKADIFVVVNTANPVRTLSTREVADLYLGRSRTYPNGLPAQIIDQPNARSEREQFFRLLVNMPLAQVNAYWARLTFTGRQSPPEIRTDDQAVLADVSRSAQAIGYVGSRPQNPDVHVILQLRE
jgi:ABC-type phosphate transport system substrate-binding protein